MLFNQHQLLKQLKDSIDIKPSEIAEYSQHLIESMASQDV